MKHTVQQYAEALYQSLTETNPKEQDKVIANLVSIMTKNGDIGRFEEIVKAFEKISAKQSGEVEATVKVAHKDADDKQVVEALNKMGAKKVKINKEVDESLIGGVVIRMDDTLIDASVKHSLDKIHDALIK